MGENQHCSIQRGPQQHFNHGSTSWRGFSPLPSSLPPLPRPLQQGRIDVRVSPVLVGIHKTPPRKNQKVGQTPQMSVQKT